MPSPHSHTQATPINQDDEGDICPICESECTCDNNKLSIAPPKQGLLPPLKPKTSASASSKKPSDSHKQIRSKPSTSTSTNPHLPQTGQFYLSDPRLKSHLLDPTVPKRRGRPPKVVVAARAALAAAAANSSPECVAGPSTVPHRPKPKFLKKLSKPRQKSKVRGSNPIKASSARRKHRVDDTYHPKGHVRRRPLVEDQDESGGDDDDEKFLLEDDDDVEPSAPLDLPTFISASSSSSESSSLSSLSSSDDSGSEDAEMQEEEEQNIKESEDERERKARKDKARVRRELLGEKEGRQNGRSHHNSNRWDIKPRKRSVSASDGEADVDMDADSGDTTESEDEDQDAVVADDEDELDTTGVDRDGRRKLGVSFAGVVTGWSDGEDSNYDADLFFDNLDSSGSDSDVNIAAKISSMDADEEDEEQDSGDEIAEAMTLAAAAGLYDGLSFDAAQGWGGQFVFATHDIDVEMDLSPSPKGRRPLSPSFLTTDDELAGHQATAQPIDGNEDHLEEMNGMELAESDGETTEEELIGVDGRPNARAMMLFKWPVTVGAVDPKNTLTPDKRRTRPANRRSTLQQEPDELEDSSDKSLDGTKTPSGKTGRVPRTPRGPMAGAFQLTPQTVEPTKTAVITGKQPALPSPYPRSRRMFSSVERIGRRAIRDRSLSISGQSSVQTDVSSVPSHSTELDVFTTESMDLDEVLEAAFLVSDSSTSEAELSSHVEHMGDRTDVGDMSSRSHIDDLRRWDRIPMTAFRHTRESRGSISNEDGTPWSGNSGETTDFYAVAMRNSNLQHLMSPSPVPQKQLAALSSPISLPASSPSNVRGGRNFRMLTRDGKSERERKEEKKALRKMNQQKASLGRPINSNHQVHQHHRHQHHPNTKSRASGSMQRTNFFSSPLTPGNP